MNDDVTLTQSAAGKILTLISEEQNPHLKLRIYIEGGGCSGMQYGFTFETQINQDDLTFIHHGVTLVVDAISSQYLLGAEIDYKDDKLNGSRFIVRNPNIEHSCGCGNSFS